LYGMIVAMLRKFVWPVESTAAHVRKRPHPGPKRPDPGLERTEPTKTAKKKIKKLLNRKKLTTNTLAR